MKIVKIGRAQDNDVIISDSMVSKHHCQIIEENGKFTLIDTDSTNGTIVNGVKRHGQIRLCSADIVMLGNTVIPWQTYFSAGTQINQSSGYQAPQLYHSLQPHTPPVNRPNSYLVWAILATILCCLPFGIVSIVYAAKVDRLWAEGDYQAAYNAASNAKLWFWLSFGFGLLVQIIYISLYSLGMIASMM